MIHPVGMISADDADLPPSPMPDRAAGAAGNPTAMPPPSEVIPMPEHTRPMLSGSPSILVDGWGEGPPPGTLGRTYRRRSALMSDDLHPRMAAVLVYLPEQADVSARGLKVTWTGDVWRLETAQALIPGVPHIYAVKAEWDTPQGRAIQVRWVRLIMGRVVDLEFE